MNVQYISRNGKAGFLSHGTGPISPPIDGVHVDRVLWLVSQIEMPGGFGQIQNCQDKAVMSGGILHHIAVQPRAMTQGSLWGLLARMITAAHGDITDGAGLGALIAQIDRKGWQIGLDGVLRLKSNGTPVSGRDITKEICQSPDAVVPAPGQPGHDVARAWAQLFADAFADPSTYGAQLWYAGEWLLKGNHDDESAAYVRLTGEKNLTTDVAFHRKDLPEAADLAMAVYHSFSTNAPDVARSVLKARLAKESAPLDFARGLIKALGTNNYRNWADRTDNTSRYDRTRVAAERSGLWPADTLAMLMPRDFR